MKNTCNTYDLPALLRGMTVEQVATAAGGVYKLALQQIADGQGTPALFKAAAEVRKELDVFKQKGVIK